MSRMIQLIRASAVPPHVMHSASRGALSVPPAEMIEILVHLALHNKIFGQTAGITLAGWDESACRAVAADPQTPKEVLDYFVAPANLRPALLTALLENPSVSQAALAQLADSGHGEVLNIFLQSPRAKQSPAVMSALRSNPRLEARHAAALKADAPKAADAPAAAPGPDEDNAPADEAVHAFIAEHAAEIAATPEKPFRMVTGLDELPATAASEPAPPPSAPPVPTTAGSAAAAAPAKANIRPVTKHATPASGEGRESAVQKIHRLDIKGRIQLAIKGNKEERSILIRDGTKIVALAVLDSSKITDAEVEQFATQKNVLEAVLRTIPLKRRFAKQYPIQRNLVSNPRTPIDVSLALMKHLLINDLKNLSANKEVSETVRKLALRMYKQKKESAKQ